MRGTTPRARRRFMFYACHRHRTWLFHGRCVCVCVCAARHWQQSVDGLECRAPSTPINSSAEPCARWLISDGSMTLESNAYHNSCAESAPMPAMLLFSKRLDGLMLVGFICMVTVFFIILGCFVKTSNTGLIDCWGYCVMCWVAVDAVLFYTHTLRMTMRNPFMCVCWYACRCEVFFPVRLRREHTVLYVWTTLYIVICSHKLSDGMFDIITGGIYCLSSSDPDAMRDWSSYGYLHPVQHTHNIWLYYFNVCLCCCMTGGYDVFGCIYYVLCLCIYFALCEHFCCENAADACRLYWLLESLGCGNVYNILLNALLRSIAYGIQV